MNDPPEEHIFQPLKWDPPDADEKVIEQFEKVLEIAVSSNLIESAGADRMLKILRINPHRRLSRLGQRITILEEVVTEIQSLDRRVEIAVGDLREAHDILAGIIATQPRWRPDCATTQDE